MSRLVVPSLGFWPGLAIMVVAVTAVINFTNFMDGLDGLVAGCMAVAIAAAAFVLAAPWPIWALVGSLLGFLLWNWSPAKVFMGDVGSTWLGAVFAGMVLQQKSPWEAISLLMVAAPLLADAFVCVLRRLVAGQPVFQAHRLHLFQRLQRGGWSHAKVAAVYGLATGLLAVARQWLGMAAEVSALTVALMFAYQWERNVAVPFNQVQRDD
jgi:UDP-N-acetylmuramyl pentapeptide phosphotransferase/UDP-N-acetylglucosamine-1-phosphate transferase